MNPPPYRQPPARLFAPVALGLTALCATCAIGPTHDDQDQDGYTLEAGDCDDFNAAIHPGADDIPYNGIDEDCDGTDLTDVDGDGIDAVAAGGTDCDDDDPSTYPGAAEICDDLANGCDGFIDDADKDGSRGMDCGGSDCNDADPTINTGATEIPYDGIDQDCYDGDLIDADQDGEDPVQFGGLDCDDSNPEITSANEAFIPAGLFTLGSTYLGENSNEYPVVEVYLSGYCIDRWEVTQLEYDACDACQPEPEPTPSPSAREEAVSEVDGDDLFMPVVGVDWAQALEYCAAYGKSLPTEAQWEKAARGGHCLTGDVEGVSCPAESQNTLPEGGEGSARAYPWGEAVPDCEHSNFGDCGGAGPEPVRVAGNDGPDQPARPLGASPYDVYDLAGNVEEWVLDTYDVDFYDTLVQEPPAVDPVSTGEGGAKAIRGGSYLSAAIEIRTSSRASRSPDVIDPSLGFRCSRTIEPLL